MINGAKTFMKTEICKKEECKGCGLCVHVCPKSAISMSYDKEGFWYPEIDYKLCVGCDLCRNKCIANRQQKFKAGTSDYYMAWNNNLKERKRGSSGGIFYSLAKEIIARGGKVCGAALTEDFELRHVLISDESNIDMLCGSKYIQSNIVSVLPQIKDTIEQGIPVLFVGTPCQVDAVYAYCGESDILFTCDLICYGVGSKKVFDSCIQKLENKHGSKARKIEFRKKIHGYRNSSFSVLFENGKKYEQILYLSEYGYVFSNKLIGRPSCYRCPFSNQKRIGDITLGDYTGRDLYREKIRDIKKGVSLVRVNTYRGRKLFERLSYTITQKEKNTETIQEGAVRQNEEIVDMTSRNLFMEEFLSQGYDSAMDKYYQSSKRAYIWYRTDAYYLLAKKIYRYIFKR